MPDLKELTRILEQIDPNFRMKSVFGGFSVIPENEVEEAL